MKKVILALFVLFLTAQFIFAVNVTYRWKYSGEEAIDGFEYRLNGGDWQTVGSEVGKVTYKLTDDEVRQLTDESFEIRSFIDDRKSDSVTIPAPVKAKPEKAPKTKTKSIDDFVTVNAIPYSAQFYISKRAGVSPVASEYGYGAELSAQKYFDDNIFADASLSFMNGILGNGKPTYTNIMVSAGSGYDFKLVDKLSAFVHFDLALNINSYMNKIGTEFALKTGFGAKYMFTEKLGASVGVDGVFGFTKGYVDIFVVPSVGFVYGF